MTARGGKSRRCKAVRDWSIKVRERDGNKCQKCGSTKTLHAHHVIPWQHDESKRLDIDNGITYCSSCHSSIEKKGRIPWIAGKKHTQKTRLKMQKAKIGFVPWNKGMHSDLPEKRSCRDCGIEKFIFEFTPMQKGKWYTGRCKVCRNLMLKKKRDS